MTLRHDDLALLSARFGVARFGASRFGFIPCPEDVEGTGTDEPGEYIWREVQPPTTEWEIINEDCVCRDLCTLALGAISTTGCPNPDIDMTVTVALTGVLGTVDGIADIDWGDGRHDRQYLTPLEDSTLEFEGHYHVTGEYTITVTVTDERGCAISQTLDITVTDPLEISFVASEDPADVGEAVTYTPTVNGGLAPYTYQWVLDADVHSWAASLLAGLSHYYPMEEESGPRVDLVAGANFAEFGTPGRAAAKQDFGADVSIGSGLEIPTTDILSPAFTLAFWLNPSTFTVAGPNDAPILVSDSPTAGFDLTRDNGSTNANLIMYPSGSGSIGSNPLPTGVQHAIVVWFGDGVGGFQIDGGADTTFAASLTLDAAVNMLASFTSAVGTDGLYDEMAVWDYVLSSALRAAWRNAGTGSFYRGSTQEVPSIVYQEVGTKTVTLTVTDANGCTAEATIDVVIEEAAGIIASFTWEKSTESDLVTFTDTSTGGPDTWAWDFGDLSPEDNNQNPSHQFDLNVDPDVTTEFTVTLTASLGGDSDDAVATLVIALNPDASGSGS